MQNTKKNKRYGWLTIAFVVWFVMNIRVAIGIGSTFERAIDGLVGIAFLTVTVFVTLDFFQLIGNDKDRSD